MRHALMEEQEKSQIQTTIMNLTADCERLEDQVDQLNQDAVDIRKSDDEDRKNCKEEHEAWKKEMGEKIFVLKDEIDTMLQNPNFIA